MVKWLRGCNNLHLLFLFWNKNVAITLSLRILYWNLTSFHYNEGATKTTDTTNVTNSLQQLKSSCSAAQNIGYFLKSIGLRITSLASMRLIPIRSKNSVPMLSLIKSKGVLFWFDSLIYEFICENIRFTSSWE